MHITDRPESIRLGLAQRQIERILTPGQDIRTIAETVLHTCRDLELPFKCFRILEDWALSTYREA